MNNPNPTVRRPMVAGAGRPIPATRFDAIISSGRPWSANPNIMNYTANPIHLSGINHTQSTSSHVVLFILTKMLSSKKKLGKTILVIRPALVPAYR